MVVPHLLLSIYLSYWLKYLNYYSCTLKLIHKFIVSTYWHNRSENCYLLSLFKLFIYFLFQVSMISFSKSILVFKIWFSNFILFTITLMIYLFITVLFLSVVDAICKEEEEEKHLQELEERFLQKRKSSPAFRYENNWLC